MDLVVVGAGRIGTRVIELALADGHDVAVLDKDPLRCQAVAKRFDVVAYNVDATREALLREADADKADGIIATTREDPVNLMIMAVAKRLGIPKRVAVVSNPASAPMFADRDAEVVGSPSAIAAEHLLHAARHAGVRRHLAVAGEIHLFQVVVETDSRMDGTTLKDAPLPTGVVVVAVERAGRFIFPRGATELAAGDVVTVLGRESDADGALPLFRTEAPALGP